MNSFLLAHLSDPHLGPMPQPRLRELASKRAIGYFNWRRKRHAVHRRDVLGELVADMQAQRPDHIAVTGDLVNIALPLEFTAAREWLKALAGRTMSRWCPAITTPMWVASANISRPHGRTICTATAPSRARPSFRIYGEEVRWR